MAERSSMLTWQVDRLFRAGPLFAIMTFVVPALLAVLVNTGSDVDHVLGLMLLAAGIISIGTVAGSMVTSGMGVLLFGAGSVLAEVAPILLLVTGAGLFATLMMHDLSGSFRRAPRINSLVAKSAARTTLTVLVVSWAAFAVAYAVAGLATWQSIVVPFGFAAIGVAAKLAADAHVDTNRRLSLRRVRQSDLGSGRDRPGAV